MARSAAREARPWLRRENWTRENLRALVAAARERPRHTAAVAVAVMAVVATAAWLVRSTIRPVSRRRWCEEAAFDVSVVESGTIQALRSVTYASTIQSNQAKIIAMVPEGKLVEKGDMLILFDAAPFEEEIRRTQAQLAQAQADIQKAQQDLKLQAIQNQEELGGRAPEGGAQPAGAGRRDRRQGPAPGGGGQGRRRQRGARPGEGDRHPRGPEAAARGRASSPSRSWTARPRPSRARARTWSWPSGGTKRSCSSAVPWSCPRPRPTRPSTRESVRQLESAAQFRLEQKRSAIAAAESRIAEASAKLALARQQLARTEVRADVPGIVVYKDVFFGSEQRKPQVGDQVWANQPLLILPDISKMVVETKVRETDIHKVEKNQNVAVRVQAYPDLRLSGQVTLVGTLAQEEKERRGVKFFGVTIQVKESDPRLRPGMTAASRSRSSAASRRLRVPLEAVFERDGHHVCYVATRRGLAAREVVLGPSNRDFVVVEKGLRRGDRVALRDPAAAPSDFGSLTSS